MKTIEYLKNTVATLLKITISLVWCSYKYFWNHLKSRKDVKWAKISLEKEPKDIKNVDKVARNIIKQKM